MSNSSSDGSAGDGSTRDAAVRVAVASALFSVVHSLLASHAAKRAAERRLGAPVARGGYRLAYNGVAIGMTLGLTAYVLRRRGPMVYALDGLAAWGVRAGQLAALGLAGRAAVEAGFADLSGFGPLTRWATHGALAPVPDGQGPAEREPGELVPVGQFTRSRNPLNFYVIPVLWLAPRASAGRLGMNAVFTAYAVLGSWHANAMLAARHGPAWQAYARRTRLVLPLASRPTPPLALTDN